MTTNGNGTGGPMESIDRDSTRVPSLVCGRPGLLLDDEVALDGEDAAAFAQIEQLDQVRIDVQLRAVLAQPAGDAEAQTLAPVRKPERRVEPGGDEPVPTDGASISGGGHGAMLGRTMNDPA